MYRMSKKVLLGLLGIGIIIFAMFFNTLFKPHELTFALKADFYNQLVYVPEGYDCATNVENCETKQYYLAEFEIAGEKVGGFQTVPAEGFLLQPITVKTWSVTEGVILVPMVISWYDPFSKQSKKVVQTVPLNATLVKRTITNNELAVTIYLSDAFGPEISVNPKYSPIPTFHEQLQTLGSPNGGHGRYTLVRATVEIQMLDTEEDARMRKAYQETRATNTD